MTAMVWPRLAPLLALLVACGRPDAAAPPVEPAPVETQAASAVEAPDVPEAPSTVLRVTVYGAERSTAEGVRVVLELDRHARPVALQELSGERARVAALDLSPTRLADDVPRELAIATGGVEALELIEQPGEVVRVRLTVAPDAVVRSLTLEAPPRVVLDVSQPAGAAVGVNTACVVLDPGHGGDEWGASNGGVRESHLTLDLAQRAATRLRMGLPAMRIVMTREDDRAVSLPARVRVAQACGAILFVSIHLNDSSVSLREGGVTTFVRTGLRRADTRRLAERVHRALLAAGRATVPSLADRGVREQSFAVLEGTSMPAILVEASFMNDPEELRALRSSAYRDALGAGIADGILQYLYGE